jgi:hypothetical protein
MLSQHGPQHHLGVREVRHHCVGPGLLEGISVGPAGGHRDHSGPADLACLHVPQRVADDDGRRGVHVQFQQTAGSLPGEPDEVGAGGVVRPVRADVEVDVAVQPERGQLENAAQVDRLRRSLSGLRGRLPRSWPTTRTLLSISSLSRRPSGGSCSSPLPPSLDPATDEEGRPLLPESCALPQPLGRWRMEGTGFVKLPGERR